MAAISPKSQKNLIILVTGQTLRGGGVECSSWLLHRDDAWSWLAPRRELFPKASAQELVAMAILPKGLRIAASAHMCGLPPSKSADADLHACPAPDFEALTSTSSVCRLAGYAYGDLASLAQWWPGFRDMLGEQIAKAFPAAVRMPDGLFEQSGSPKDAVAAMVAERDRIVLEAAAAPACAPAKAKRPL